MADKDKFLVVGSLAYDHLMSFDGEFKDVMVPGNFNVALNASGRTISFGGCAGNIAYNLRLLQQNPLIFTAVGKDFAPYRDRLTQFGIDISAVYVSEQYLTAAAFIVTDKNQNQMTIFDGGAMIAVQTSQSVLDLPTASIAWAVISPDNPVHMMKVARECNEFGIPFIFDPAQQIHSFKTEDLLWAIANCNVLIVNEYEAELLAQKLGFPKEGLNTMVQTLIETYGAKGCRISSPDGMFFVRSVQPSHLVDPTGCGDAFRAGVLMGLQTKFPLQKACQVGVLIATYNLEKAGTQSHTFTIEEFAKRFEDNFGEALF